MRKTRGRWAPCQSAESDRQKSFTLGWLQRPRPESWVPERVPRNILDHRLACMPRITPSAEAVRAGKFPRVGHFSSGPRNPGEERSSATEQEPVPRSKRRVNDSRNFLRRLGIAQHCTLGSRDVNVPPNSRGDMLTGCRQQPRKQEHSAVKQIRTGEMLTGNHCDSITYGSYYVRRASPATCACATARPAPPSR